MLGDSEEHRPYEDFAVRHVMGSLDEAESGTFRSHLLDCSDCRARVGELRSIASDLAEVERDERRERAARLVETKEREEEPDTEYDGYLKQPGRGLKILLGGGVFLIVLLSIWNFVLRGQNSSLEGRATALQESAEVINFGDPWTTARVAPGVEGVARIEDGHLAVMVRGTVDGAQYQISRYDAEGDLLDASAIHSVNEQIRWFSGPTRAEAARIDVSLTRGNNQTIIFRALAE
ncbi:MAG: hypothetical protein ACR2HR_14345 [Euzebya sp.]